MLILRNYRWVLSETKTPATQYFWFLEEPGELLTSAAQVFKNFMLLQGKNKTHLELLMTVFSASTRSCVFSVMKSSPTAAPFALM